MAFPTKSSKVRRSSCPQSNNPPQKTAPLFWGVSLHMRKHRILYVEDHEDTRDLVRLLLQQRNYDVVTTDTIASALILADGGMFDLYLLDSRLPDGTGLELCKQLRLLDDLTPIVFYSAAAYEVDRNTAFDSGAQGYLVKPTANGELTRMVSELINKHRDGSV